MLQSANEAAGDRKARRRGRRRRRNVVIAIMTVGATAVFGLGLLPATATAEEADDQLVAVTDGEGADLIEEGSGSTESPTGAPLAPANDQDAPEEKDAGLEPEPELEVMSRAEALDIGISPASVPVPGANQIVISVKVGGDRVDGLGTASGMSNVDATGVAGVTLRLSSSNTAPNAWSAYPWATCTSDADGDCNFVVPVRAAATSSTGMTFAQRPWVHQVSESAPGWHLAPTALSRVATSSSGLTYNFQLSTTVTAGSTYRSTTFAPFMKYAADATADILPLGTATTPMYQSSSGRWMVLRDNPPMPQACGLDFAVVMDLSASITGQLPAAKAALDALVDNLVGTPSNVALFNFNTNSPGANLSGFIQPMYTTPMSVRTTSDAASVKALYAPWQLGGSTNWDQALVRVADAAPQYDVVVFITDGIPTIHTNQAWPLPRDGWGNLTTIRSLEAAAYSANLVKAEGTRVVPFFVGTSSGPLVQNNLQLLSGPTLGSDYFVASDYTAAAQTLASFAKSNCQSSVQVEKRVVDPGFNAAGATKAQLDANSTAAPNWVFTASATAPASISGGTTTFTTAADGRTTVPVSFTNPATSGTVTITEQQQTDYTLVQVGGSNAHCVNANTSAQVPVTNVGSVSSANPGFSTTATAQVPLECVVYNQAPAPTASISVSKRVQDVDGQNEQPAAGWTLGAVVTATTGTATGSPTAMTQVTPASGTVPWTVVFGGSSSRATVDISETQQPGWSFVTGSCTITPESGPVVTQSIPSAAGITLSNVAPGDAVECTFVNKPETGRVLWEKVDGAGGHLAGSTWTLTGPGAGGAATTIADCLALPCTGADGDERPGYFEVNELAWGDYTLVETAAPAGYVLDATPHPFAVGTTAPAQLVVDLGEFVNQQQLVPSIPLTGGIGRDHLFIAGGILSALAIVLVIWHRHRRKAAPMPDDSPTA